MWGGRGWCGGAGWSRWLAVSRCCGHVDHDVGKILGSVRGPVFLFLGRPAVPVGGESVTVAGQGPVLADLRWGV